MNKVDKILTHKLWAILIVIVLIIWITDDSKKSIQLIGIIVFCTFILIWALIAVSNPKNVRGVVHWRSGEVTYTGVFNRYSDFEDWREDFLKYNSHNIYTITYEFIDRENDE